MRVSNASLDVERGRPLLKSDYISKKTFDDRENIVREAEAAVKVAEARVKAAELDLSFCRVTAPISGRISRTLVTPGNFVSGGGTDSGHHRADHDRHAGPDLHLLRRQREQRSQIHAPDGSERQGRARHAGGRGRRRPARRGRASRTRGGSTSSTIAWTRAPARCAHAPSSRTRTALFSPGMFARVRLQGSPEYTAVLLPDEAIGTDQANRFVYVVGDDDIPVRRLVELGPLVDGLRVMREGVSADDWVVIRGQQRVRPDQKIAPKHIPLKVSDAKGRATSSVKKP